MYSTERRRNASMPDCTVIPVLAYPDVSAAVAWLTDAFGFQVRWQIEEHRAQLAIGAGGCVAVKEGDAAPADTGDSIMIRVDDVDAHYERVIERRVPVAGPPASFPYGERQYTAIDPTGRQWTFSGTVQDAAPEEWGARRG